MRKSTTAILWAAALPLALAACGDGNANEKDAAKASGQQGERRFAFNGFDRVTLAGPDNVEVKVGPGYAVQARGDTGLIDALDIKVDGGNLEIGRKERRGFSWGDADDGGSVRVVVTMPAIRGAVIAGAGDMTVSPIAGEAFDGAIAGAGDMQLSGIAVQNISLSIAGTGDLKAAGRAQQAKVSIAGAGDIDAGGLTAAGADVNIVGAGNARMAVNGPAKVAIMGSGAVDLGPKARCTTSMVGAGDVTCGR